VVQREAYILKSSDDGKKHVCIDAENEASILDFLERQKGAKKKFQYIVGIILSGIHNSHLYGDENINDETENVTAMKMFQSGANIRLYCKEQEGLSGTFYVIVAELLPKKKTQKVTGDAKQLIKKVGNYEYKIIERPPAAK